MGRQHYFAKLIPPRPAFPMDITESEKQLMQEPSRYMHEGIVTRKVLIYGPVMAEAGAFGMAVFQVKDEAELRQFWENAPTVKAGLNRFEYHPMRLGAAQGSGSED